jgi:hypothetical protein
VIGFDDPLWLAYDRIARAVPDCEHIRAWTALGPGRPEPPDCEHSRPWREEVRVAWDAYRQSLHQDEDEDEEI